MDPRDRTFVWWEVQEMSIRNILTFFADFVGKEDLGRGKALGKVRNTQNDFSLVVCFKGFQPGLLVMFVNS